MPSEADKMNRMEKRIETLEDLNQRLGDPSFDMTFYWAKTDMEVLAWLLVAHIAFDPQILIKGTRAPKVPTPLPDDYKARMWEQYGEAFSATNHPLREWLTTTPYENIAAYATYLVRRTEIGKVTNYYDTAQDFYADHWREFDDFSNGEKSGREYVNAFFAQVDELNAHIDEGKSLGLTMDEIILHDAMWGLLPRGFDETLVAIARDTLKEAIAQLPSRPYIWSEKGKTVYAPQMLEYAAGKLADAGYDIGYQKHYSIEQGYLLDYFARLYWREAASKPEE